MPEYESQDGSRRFATEGEKNMYDADRMEGGNGFGVGTRSAGDWGAAGGVGTILVINFNTGRSISIYTDLERWSERRIIRPIRQF